MAEDLWQCQVLVIKFIQEFMQIKQMCQYFQLIIKWHLKTLSQKVLMTVGRHMCRFYKFVKKFIVIFYNYIEFVPKKVILTGDSAGGNLIAALTYLTIMTKNRIPDGLLMSYPALYCSD